MLDEHFQPAFDSRTLADVLEPTFRVGVIIQRNFLALPVAHPRIGRDVGNRVIIPGKIAGFAQTRVGHAKQTFRFIRIAVDGILNSVGRVTPEMIGLPHHGTDAAHLPHQPFIQGNPATRVLLRMGNELAKLVCQINQDRTGFEHADRRAARPVFVKDGGNLVVRTDLEKVGFELVVVTEIDAVQIIFELTLLQHNVELVAVRRRCGIGMDHGSRFPEELQLCVDSKIGYPTCSASFRNPHPYARPARPSVCRTMSRQLDGGDGSGEIQSRQGQDYAGRPPLRAAALQPR